MANIYWGDSFNTPDGNWNNSANWWSALGTSGDAGTSGVPAGRVPHAGDSVVLAGGYNSVQATLVGDITTGPAGGWAGPISYLTSLSFPNGIFVRAGSYSGAIQIGASNAAPSLSAAAPTVKFGIVGGSFSAAVSLGTTSLASSNFGFQVPTISGGTFTGSVSRSPCTAVGQDSIISGGTYSPTASVIYDPATGHISNPSALPNDPGFAAGGGTFSPVISVTGVP